MSSTIRPWPMTARSFMGLANVADFAVESCTHRLSLCQGVWDENSMLPLLPTIEAIPVRFGTMATAKIADAYLFASFTRAQFELDIIALTASRKYNTKKGRSGSI